MKKTILVTGADGQLGQCMRNIHTDYPGYRFLFMTSEVLDITNSEILFRIFEKKQPDYCFNFAAYTNVEQAENEQEKAFRVNAEGVACLAEVCKKYNVILFHISTDYVFDGLKTTPYTPEDEPNPLNVYGRSKLEGERRIQQICEKYFIIRTSWLYSEFGKNFYKTIRERVEKGETLQVTDRETGCPTNANDLAVFLMNMVSSNFKKYGIYHFCGEKAMTWYEFALLIVKKSDKQIPGKVVKTKNYHTFAARPVYSVLQPSHIAFEDEKPAT